LAVPQEAGAEMTNCTPPEWPPIGIKWYYSDDVVAIAHRDCREILPLLPQVDLVLTDPPYGIGEAYGKNRSRGKLAISKDYGISEWDDEPTSQDLLDAIIHKAKHSIIFGGNYYQLPPSSCWLVWDKDNGTNDFADCELAWTNFTSAVRKYLWRWNGMLQQPGHPKDFRYHPTQKPSGLFSLIIADYSKKDDLILDPYMGSGTTLVCAKKLGRKAIGIETELKYVEIAIKRLQQMIMPIDWS
jgi:DNA modification methylase